MKLRKLSSVLFLGLAALAMGPIAAGCTVADESTEEDDVTSKANEVRGNLFGEVGVVRIIDATKPGAPPQFIAAPSKVARVLKLTGLRKDSKAPKLGGIRCLPRYTIEFLSPKMKRLAVAGFACSAGSSQGSVQVSAKKQSYLINADLDAVNEIIAEPRLVGDVLYGITNVSLKRFGKESHDTGSSDYLDDTLAAFNKNQQPKSGAVPKCVPQYQLTFSRGKDVVAFANVLCSGDSTLLVPKKGGSATELDTLGLIKVDAKTIDLVLASLEEIDANWDDWGNFTPDE